MLAATRRGVYNELERTVRRTASDADVSLPMRPKLIAFSQIKRRARDMINHMRGAMRAAAGDGGSRSRRYSEGNA
jgi:hypothetical protein